MMQNSWRKEIISMGTFWQKPNEFTSPEMEYIISYNIKK